MPKSLVSALPALALVLACASASVDVQVGGSSELPLPPLFDVDLLSAEESYEQQESLWRLANEKHIERSRSQLPIVLAFTDRPLYSDADNASVRVVVTRADASTKGSLNWTMLPGAAVTVELHDGRRGAVWSSRRRADNVPHMSATALLHFSIPLRDVAGGDYEVRTQFSWEFGEVTGHARRIEVRPHHVAVVQVATTLAPTADGTGVVAALALTGPGGEKFVAASVTASGCFGGRVLATTTRHDVDGSTPLELYADASRPCADPADDNRVVVVVADGAMSETSIVAIPFVAAPPSSASEDADAAVEQRTTTVIRPDGLDVEVFSPWDRHVALPPEEWHDDAAARRSQMTVQVRRHDGTPISGLHGLVVWRRQQRFGKVVVIKFGHLATGHEGRASVEFDPYLLRELSPSMTSRLERDYFGYGETYIVFTSGRLNATLDEVVVEDGPSTNGTLREMLTVRGAVSSRVGLARFVSFRVNWPTMFAEQIVASKATSVKVRTTTGSTFELQWHARGVATTALSNGSHIEMPGNTGDGVLLLKGSTCVDYHCAHLSIRVFKHPDRQLRGTVETITHGPVGATGEKRLRVRVVDATTGAPEANAIVLATVANAAILRGGVDPRRMPPRIRAARLIEAAMDSGDALDAAREYLPADAFTDTESTDLKLLLLLRAGGFRDMSMGAGPTRDLPHRPSEAPWPAHKWLGIDVDWSSVTISGLHEENFGTSYIPPVDHCDDEAQCVFPVTISWNLTSGQRLVGTAAAAALVANSLLLGTDAGQAEWMSLSLTSSGIVVTRIAVDGNTTTEFAPSVVVPNDRGAPRKYTREDIMAIILRQIKVAAEKQLNDTDAFDNVDVAFPSHFSDADRSLVRTAAHIAGLKVHRVFLRPTAVCLGHGLHLIDRGGRKNILVMDSKIDHVSLDLVVFDAGVFRLINYYREERVNRSTPVGTSYFLDKIRDLILTSTSCAGLNLAAATRAVNATIDSMVNEAIATWNTTVDRRSPCAVSPCRRCEALQSIHPCLSSWVVPADDVRRILTSQADYIAGTLLRWLASNGRSSTPVDFIIPRGPWSYRLARRVARVLTSATNRTAKVVPHLVSASAEGAVSLRMLPWHSYSFVVAAAVHVRCNGETATIIERNTQLPAWNRTRMTVAVAHDGWVNCSMFEAPGEPENSPLVAPNASCAFDMSVPSSGSVEITVAVQFDDDGWAAASMNRASDSAACRVRFRHHDVDFSRPFERPFRRWFDWSAGENSSWFDWAPASGSMTFQTFTRSITYSADIATASEQQDLMSSFIHWGTENGDDGPAGPATRRRQVATGGTTLSFPTELVLTDADGVAEWSFPAGDVTGLFDAQVDLLAPADGALGETSHEISFTLPVSLDARVPHAMATGDVAHVPLVATIAKSDQSISAARCVFRVDARGATGLVADGITVTQDDADRGRCSGFATLRAVYVEGLAGLPASTATVAFSVDMVPDGAAAPVASDAVEMSLVVHHRPPGAALFEHSVGSGGLLAGDGSSFTMDVTVPTDAQHVSYSAVLRGRGSASTLLRATEGLLRTPTGCFEQSASSAVPSAMAMQLLSTLRPAGRSVAVNETLRAARGHVETGYARMVRYECTSGGFDYFGGAIGNAALTAYGLEVFEAMDRAVPGLVDRAMIARTAAWLSGAVASWDWSDTRRAAAHAHALSRAMDAAAHFGVSLASLAERLDRLETLAGSYSSGYLSPSSPYDDPYWLAATSAALFAANRTASSAALAGRLVARQREDGSLMSTAETFTYSRGANLRIETTALSALALLQHAKEEAPLWDAARRALAWLAKQREGGRTGSTQATVLSLRALVAFEALQATGDDEEAAQEIIVSAAPLDRSVAGRLSATIHRTDASQDVDLAAALEAAHPGARSLMAGWAGGCRFEVRCAVPVGAAAAASRAFAVVDVAATFASTAPPRTGRMWRIETEVRRAGDTGAPTAADNNITVDQGAALAAVVRVASFHDELNGMVVATIGLPRGTDMDAPSLRRQKAAGAFDHFELREQGSLLDLYWRSFPAGGARTVTVALVAATPGCFHGDRSRVFEYYGDRDSEAIAMTPMALCVTPRDRDESIVLCLG